MPENKNGSQEGRPVSPEGASWDTNQMIWNARSLQRVLNTMTALGRPVFERTA